LTEKLIVDSSPLIVLLKSDLENILPALFEEILVPEMVWQEISAGKENDVARQKLPHLSWIKRIPVTASTETIESYNLGKGETDVLNLALTIPQSRVMLDDFAARKAAKTLKIPILGTGGLLILAKQENLIPSVTEALRRVQNEGLWLSDEIIKLIKQKARE
jgi:predicted nucleic acid-binding protein